MSHQELIEYPTASKARAALVRMHGNPDIESISLVGGGLDTLLVTFYEEPVDGESSGDLLHDEHSSAFQEAPLAEVPVAPLTGSVEANIENLAPEFVEAVLAAQEAEDGPEAPVAAPEVSEAPPAAPAPAPAPEDEEDAPPAAPAPAPAPEDEEDAPPAAPAPAPAPAEVLPDPETLDRAGLRALVEQVGFDLKIPNNTPLTEERKRVSEAIAADPRWAAPAPAPDEEEDVL